MTLSLIKQSVRFRKINSGLPFLLCTDIVSGPNAGGENNDGAYLTIFGKNFGSNINNLSVTIGGIAVASKIALVDSHAHALMAIKALSVRVGLLGVLALGVNHLIVVSNPTGSSVQTLNFMIQPGDIIFVSDTGDDSSGDGSFNLPYEHVQADGDYNGAAYGDMGPGDTIICRGSSNPVAPTLYQAQGAGGSGTPDFLRVRNRTANAPNGTVGNGPMTFMGYPGEYVEWKPAATVARCVGRSNSVPADGAYITFSNLVMTPGPNGDGKTDDQPYSDGAISPSEMGLNWRMVNLDTTYRSAVLPRSEGNGADGPKGAAITGTFVDSVLYCCEIHDCEGSNRNHCIYLDSNTDGIDIAWNHIHHCTLGNLFQAFNSFTGLLSNITLRHNIIHNGGRYGLNFSDQTDTFYCYNNIIYTVTRAWLRYASGSTDCYSEVYNNTAWDINGVSGASGENRGAILCSAGTQTGFFANNITYAATDTELGYWNRAGGTIIGITKTDNLYFGLPFGVPPGDINAVDADPLFTNPANGDFSLQENSPAIGSATLNHVILTRDIIYALRPTNYGQGALERV